MNSNANIVTGAAYYRARLEQERRLATEAGDPAVACVHRELADRYQRLLGSLGDNMSPPLNIVAEHDNDR